MNLTPSSALLLRPMLHAVHSAQLQALIGLEASIRSTDGQLLFGQRKQCCLYILAMAAGGAACLDLRSSSPAQGGKQ